jgi:PAS domain S-box-containing protein
MGKGHSQALAITVALCISAAHIAALAISPGLSKSLASFVITFVAILCATIAAFHAAMRSEWPIRRFWLLIGAGLFIVGSAQIIRIHEQFFMPAPPEEALGASDFLFLFWVVPLLLALLPRQDRNEGLRPTTYIDVLQVVTICAMLFASLVYYPDLASKNPAFFHLRFSIILVARNAFLTAAFWIRGVISRRKSIKTVAAFLTIYTVGSVIGHWIFNTVAVRPKWIELEGSVPFAFAVVLFATWTPAAALARKKSGEVRRLLSLHLIPILLPLAVVASALFILRANFAVAAVGISVSAILFALRLLFSMQAEYRALSARKAAEVQFQTLADSLPGAVYLVKHEQGFPIVYLSEGVVRVNGYTREEYLREKSGIHLFADPMERKEAERIVSEAVARRQPYQVQFRISDKFGRIRWVEHNGTGIYDGNTLLYLCGFTTDITDKLRAQERLQQGQRMEALGSMAGGVAHDFNNVLSIIIGYTSMLEGTATDEQKPFIKGIWQASNNAADLVKRLIAFSRRQPVQPTRIKLGQIVSELSALLKPVVPSRISLRFEFEESHSSVIADRNEIEQVVINLVVNARDALAGQGEIIVSVTSAMIAESDGNVPPGDYVVLEVRDDGPGIDKTVKEHIFEPFFTTKGEMGTGLGLATVYSIVRQSGGYVSLDSELSKGTTFRVYLPRADQSGVQISA